MGLRELRAAAQMTQEELAEKAGVSRIMISMYENGTAEPSEKTKAALCKALDVTMECLDGTVDELLADAAAKLSFLFSISSALSCGDKEQKKALADIFSDACEKLSGIARKVCEKI